MTTAYDMYAPPIYGMLLRLVSEESLASMLLQQTFVEYSKHTSDTFPTLIDLIKIMMKVLRNSGLYSLEELKAKSRTLVATTSA
jgi:hypothetical protein